MTDAAHPISPPMECITRWRNEWFESDRVENSEYQYIANQAARWGSDQELEACIAWMKQRYGDESPAMALLRKHRRPTMPSLMERALNGDAAAARQFLHEAGFTDADGQWLPQYQSQD